MNLLEMHLSNLVAAEMRVSIPYAGIFCAFPKKSAWAVVCAARFYVFAMTELPRYVSTGIRVQLCPELPDQTQEMAFAESSNWGLSACAGASQVLYLVKGVRFRVRFLDQEKELTWVGMRGELEFTMPAAHDKGEMPNAADEDRRDILNNTIVVDLLEGIGTRASNVRACAKVRAHYTQPEPYALKV
jgi:hypothetical protein